MRNRAMNIVFCLFISIAVNCFGESILNTKYRAQAKSDKSVGLNQSNKEEIDCKFSVPIMINFKVLNKSGEEVKDLTRSQILILEDGEAQQIDFMRVFSNVEVKTYNARYRIGYIPLNENSDGKYRKIKLLIKENKKYKIIYTPKGYYPKKIDN